MGGETRAYNLDRTRTAGLQRFKFGKLSADNLPFPPMEVPMPCIALPWHSSISPPLNDAIYLQSTAAATLLPAYTLAKAPTQNPKNDHMCDVKLGREARIRGPYFPIRPQAPHISRGRSVKGRH
jgi:hypothetical protein